MNPMMSRINGAKVATVNRNAIIGEAPTRRIEKTMDQKINAGFLFHGKTLLGEQQRWASHLHAFLQAVWTCLVIGKADWRDDASR